VGLLWRTHEARQGNGTPSRRADGRARHQPSAPDSRHSREMRARAAADHCCGAAHGKRTDASQSSADPKTNKRSLGQREKNRCGNGRAPRSSPFVPADTLWVHGLGYMTHPAHNIQGSRRSILPRDQTMVEGRCSLSRQCYFLRTACSVVCNAEHRRTGLLSDSGISLLDLKGRGF
jgi:hypothetical protein